MGYLRKLVISYLETAEDYGVFPKYETLPVGLLDLLFDHLDKPLSRSKYDLMLRKYKDSIKTLPKGKRYKNLYRGIKLSKNLIKALLLGKKLNPKGPVESWTIDRFMSRKFGPVVFRKEIPHEQRLVFFPELIIDEDITHEMEMLVKSQVLSIDDLAIEFLLPDFDPVGEYEYEDDRPVLDIFSLRELIEIYKGTPSSKVKEALVKKIKDDSLAGRIKDWSQIPPKLRNLLQKHKKAS